MVNISLAMAGLRQSGHVLVIKADQNVGQGSRGLASFAAALSASTFQASAI
jgi:hypothetical protein